MTKHLGAKIINKNVDKMKMSFEAGRAAKAAALHAVSAAQEQFNIRGDYSCTMARCTGGDTVEEREGDLSSWQAVCRAANDQRGGDRWKSRGSEGICHRWHTSPRLSLLTPFKVAKGAASIVGLQRHRFTYGIKAGGRSFEFHDDWTKPERAHMVLDEPWIGYTVFTERSEGYMATQKGRPRGTPIAGRASASI